MLVNMRDLLADARVGGYAVGYFSVANMEMVLGVLQAAEELRAPVILQIAEVRLRQSPLELIGPLMVAAARQASVPVAVHFDHGKTEQKIGRALALGFTSVMFDGSHLPLEENIAETCRIIEMASPYGAAVEDAVRFEQETGVDALAIAIGNAHVNYKATPKLRFDILAQVAEDTHTPLVLHGGTGISPEDFRRCAQTGIQKINIATATFDSVEQTVRGAYDAGAIGGYYDLQGAEVQGAYKNAHRHILIFGTDGKA